MPSHDWSNDENTMSRDRGDMRERGYGDYGRSDYGRRERGYESRDRDAFFDRDRERGERFERDRDGRDRNGHLGGWGGLMGDETSGDRDRYRDRERFESRDRDRNRDSFRGEDRRFGSDDHNRGIAMDETRDLIASNKVEGTPVYDRHGDKLGSVHNFMVHKTKGHVVYAVLKHGGGFLGLNERYYPLEWNQLDYDTRLGGYHTRLDEEDLKSIGSFDSEGRYSRSRNGGRDRSSREGW